MNTEIKPNLYDLRSSKSFSRELHEFPLIFLNNSCEFAKFAAVLVVLRKS